MKSTRIRRLNLMFLALILVAGGFISGCRGGAQPDPAMTAVRASGTGSGDGMGGDWIRPEDLSRAGELGLDARDGASMGVGDRIEGLFNPVYFEFDQSFIRPEDRGLLQQVAEYLGSQPNARVLIEGHCDWRGTTEYNLALGERRARSVRSYLEGLGVAGTRMETVSKGDLQAVKEGTDEQMARDRRADLIFFR